MIDSSRDLHPLLSVLLSKSQEKKLDTFKRESGLTRERVFLRFTALLMDVVASLLFGYECYLSQDCFQSNVEQSILGGMTYESPSATSIVYSSRKYKRYSFLAWSGKNTNNNNNNNCTSNGSSSMSGGESNEFCFVVVQFTVLAASWNRVEKKETS